MMTNSTHARTRTLRALIDGYGPAKVTRPAARAETRQFFVSPEQMPGLRKRAIRLGGGIAVSAPVRQSGIDGYLVSVKLPAHVWAAHEGVL